jgi:penicillin-insensitive murein endopeptidase
LNPRLSRILNELKDKWPKLRPVAWPAAIFGLALVLTFILAWSLSRRFNKEPNPWPLVKAPIGDSISARSIGSYSAGCLVGGTSLPPDGPGFQLMRLTRRRFYGHPMLIEFILKLADRASRQHLGTLLIGDLGQPRGGPTNSNHRSHQTGLDVDIWFWRAPDASKRSLTLDERESLSAPSYVAADGQHVTQWGAAETKLLKDAVSFDTVERIFVNAAIKRYLCETVPPGKRDWLRKLRPWYGHDDHMHVRLKCPPGHPECSTQEGVPSGDGCDSSLDWWFSAEAKKKGGTEGDQGAVPPVPKLPPECAAVLAGKLEPGGLGPLGSP